KVLSSCAVVGPVDTALQDPGGDKWHEVRHTGPYAVCSSSAVNVSRTLGKTHLDRSQKGTACQVRAPAVLFSCTHRPERCARTWSGPSGPCWTPECPSTGPRSPLPPGCIVQRRPGSARPVAGHVWRRRCAAGITSATR